LVLCAGVNNAFLTGDMFNLYVGVEILLTSSFVLITLGGTRDRIRSGTVYVAVSMVGSAIFLVALACLYGACGTMNMAQLSMRLTEIDPAVAMLIQTLFLVAFGLKAAVFPLSAWLPDSYPTAPAPITAVFAGLLTKVGVYAIIRMQVLIFPTSPVDVVLAVVGIFTMIVGILGAVAQDDIKRLLSFTLVSHIGFMIWGISLANTLGIASAVFYAVHHILVQTTLFLVAGMMEKVGGSTSLRRLHSLAKISPLLAVWYLIPAFNLVGFPPLTGFLGKLGLAEATAARNTPLAWALLAAGLVASLLTLYVVVKIWLQTFWQGRESAQESGGEEEEAVDTLNPASRIPRGVWAATGFLTAVTIGLSVFAGPVYTFTERATISMSRAEYQRAVLGEDGRGHGISKLASDNWEDSLNEDNSHAEIAAAKTSTKSFIFDAWSLSPQESNNPLLREGGRRD
ncbi:MAG: proton-conducting transporter membrane subunit, partial [Varibaculum cambriense]|nr:proton-conducting transporter membrane subunit [Varibaculum cambriense]